MGAGVLALALWLAACSSPSADDPGTTAPVATAPSLPDSGAPKVDRPLATDRFEAKPCSVAPPAALKKANMELRPAESKPDDSIGSTCNWRFKQEGYGSIGGTFAAISDRGLSELYDQRDEWAVFQELSIVGYPAVIYDLRDARQLGTCGLAVGIRDDQTYDVGVGLNTEHPDEKNPCKVAKGFATIAVETMKQGQG